MWTRWEVEAHGPQGDSHVDEGCARAFALLDEEYPALREFFEDLLEIELTVYGAVVRRADTQALIAEYDLD
ncbi:MAG: hypothetical protein GX620_03240 [Chloroflexi bacterium]|nr:hypothetical protein [Chloroflexota bacterium]